ncbi:hypothetical protein GQ43DRAFT_432083 [Delitschia confertaspora ATCC 74209]|uniref:Zn(2)-C6 fungal-type domain-containing protein n=1 Tax=Delitschia confertaspora ATCC 74209 TaxID=1513339 RepID=A0A9P4JPU5_9PLEO|nr:hypothetical protein GQ43DRAFT_432083 [Delitschia confertaspora ATCC 74209]
MTQHLFRPLQPALPVPGVQAANESPERQDSRQPVTIKPKRILTIGACAACRKRKSKCDGLRPTCTCCIQKQTPCHYDLGPNERPSQAMKRRNEEIQSEIEDLRTIYDCLSTASEYEAEALLRRMRGVSMGSVAGVPVGNGRNGSSIGGSMGNGAGGWGGSTSPPNSDSTSAAGLGSAASQQRIRELAELVRRGEVLGASLSLEPEDGRITLPPIREVLRSAAPNVVEDLDNRERERTGSGDSLVGRRISREEDGQLWMRERGSYDECMNVDVKER